MKKRARTLSPRVGPTIRRARRLRDKEKRLAIDGLPRERVVERISRAFIKDGVKPRIARDIAFHMTDWKQELDTLSHIWRGTDKLQARQLVMFISGFLAHVPNHIAAAKKLAGLGPVADIFDVGALDPDEE